MRRLTPLVILAAFVFSLGGHWYVLQGLAWINMVREYSQMVPLKEAVAMTLSGQYPCPICKAIAEKKNSEQEKTLAVEKYDKQFSLPAPAVPPRPLVADFEYPNAPNRLLLRSESPPTPPPRPVLS